MWWSGEWAITELHLSGGYVTPCWSTGVQEVQEWGRFPILGTLFHALLLVGHRFNSAVDITKAVRPAHQSKSLGPILHFSKRPIWGQIHRRVQAFGVDQSNPSPV